MVNCDRQTPFWNLCCLYYGLCKNIWIGNKLIWDKGLVALDGTATLESKPWITTLVADCQFSTVNLAGSPFICLIYPNLNYLRILQLNVYCDH